MSDNKYSQDKQKQQGTGLPERSSIKHPNNSLQELTNQILSKLSIDFILEKTSQKLGKKELKEAFREAVREGISAAEPHRTWIAEIDRIAKNARDLEELRVAISAYLRQAGITRIDDFLVDEERFIMIRKGTGKPITTQPAYIDEVTGRTILAGRAHTEMIEQQKDSGDYKKDEE